jgi:hypothetical protein
MSVTKLNKRWALTCALVCGLAVWGCDGVSDITGLDGLGDPISLSREMTLGELQDALSGGVARAEIELIGEGYVAHRVVLGHAEAKHEQEEIESRVTDIEIVGDDGILTLMLGGLQVTFDPETSFRIGDHELGFEAFVDRVESALAEDFEPWVKARRRAPEGPQDPGVAAFHAHGLNLMEEGEGHEIEINVDADNLALNSDPQDGEPDGWINVLGLSIELRVSDGVTELGTEDVEEFEEVEFEGVVGSVDLVARTFTFTDGTLVEVVDETSILETEFETQLLSLEAVHEALEADHKVVAWGSGDLESKDPRVIVALELRFAIHGDAGGDKDHVGFEGYVTSVNFGNNSFILKNGTVVQITENTELIMEGEGESLGSLEDVHAALEAGDKVFAYGAGDVEGVDPLTIVAYEMRFVLKSDGGALEGFEGYVNTVNFDGFGSFTLTNGTVVHMLEETIIKQADQGESLMSLAAVHEALEAGHDVIAWGEGEAEGTEPLTIAALKVYFVLAV